MPVVCSSADADALARIANELTAVRQRLDRLAAENEELRGRLECSDRARADLEAQAAHLLDVLAYTREQLRTLSVQQKASGGRG